MKKLPSAQKGKKFLIRWVKEHPESLPAIMSTLESWRPGIEHVVAAMKEADAALEHALTAEDLSSAYAYFREHPLSPDAMMHLIIASQERVESAQRAQHAKHVKSRADAKNAQDPKHAAMQTIRAEFDRWQAGEVSYTDTAHFATRMHADHSGVIEHERSIVNAVHRWRKQKKTSS